MEEETTFNDSYLIRFQNGKSFRFNSVQPVVVGPYYVLGFMLGTG